MVRKGGSGSYDIGDGGRKEIRNKRGGLHGIGVWGTSWKEGVNPMV